MAARGDRDGAAANGFGRRTLREKEARALYEHGYPCPPDMRCGPSGWHLSFGGVPVPPVPATDSAAFYAAVNKAFYAHLTNEERADPAWNPADRRNVAQWRQRLDALRAEEIDSLGDDPIPPETKGNSAGRRRWWSEPGRTLAAVMRHIADGGEHLHWPGVAPPPPAPIWWDARRMAPSASSASASSSRTSGSAAWATSSPASASPPARRRSSSGGGIIIRDAGPSTKKVKKEPGSGSQRGIDELARRQEYLTDEEALLLALEQSKHDVPALPLPDALDWSRKDYEQMQRAGGMSLGRNDDEAEVSNAGCRRRLRRSNPLPPPKEESSSDDDEEEDYEEALGRNFYRRNFFSS